MKNRNLIVSAATLLIGGAGVALFAQSRDRSDRSDGSSSSTSSSGSSDRESRRDSRSSRSRDDSRSSSSRSESTSGGGTSSASYREQYDVLADHNFFLKDRRRVTTAPVSTRPAPKPPEEMFVLTGVVYEPLEDKAFAYFEDLSAGKFVRVLTGDKLARGSIAAIDINAVAFERDGKQVPVLVGDDLTGKRASVSGSSSSSSSTSSSASGAPAPSAAPVDPNNPNLTLEERMRLRRQTEGRR